MTRELTETEKTILVLDQAKELIRDPKRWTKGRFDHHEGDKPVAWCMVGAIHHVVTVPRRWDVDGELQLRADAVAALKDAIGAGSVPSYNDEPCRTHAQVMKAFDRAIERLRKKQP